MDIDLWACRWDYSGDPFSGRVISGHGDVQAYYFAELVHPGPRTRYK
jgi:hypothetical protein